VARTLEARGKLSKGYPLAMDAPLPELLRRCTLFADDPLVLLLDQFEELFNYHRHQPEFRPFIRELSAAIRDNAAATRFPISMREDFALELNAFKPELPTQLFDNYFRLEALSCEKASEVIEAPLQRVNAGCERGLLDALLDKLGQCSKQPAPQDEGAKLLEIPPSRIEPAQIQMVCTQLREREQAIGSRRLRLATYE
jgi:hypothetical protein